MDDAGAHGSLRLEVEPAHDLERVVVAMPDRDATLAEPLGDLACRSPLDVEREGRDAAVHRRKPVEAARLRQTRQELLAQLTLVRLDRVPADRTDVIDGCDESREQLVRQRSRLEPVTRRLVRGRTHL